MTDPALDTAENHLTDLIDRWKIDTYPAADLMPSAEKMPAFLADIDTVLRDLRRERSGHLGTMRERDRATEAADLLAYTVASEGVIGEHCGDNDPWENALDVIREQQGRHVDLINWAIQLGELLGLKLEPPRPPQPRPERHIQPGVEGDEPTHPGSFWHCEQPACAKARAQHEAVADIQDLTAQLFADDARGGA